MESANEMNANWIEQKLKLKERFAKLTDTDLLFDKGRKEEMLLKLQYKLGMTKEELSAIITAL